MKLSQTMTDAQALKKIQALLARIAASATRFPDDPAAQRERIQRAKSDYFYFCKTYLPHWFGCEFADAHYQLLDELGDPGQKLIQWPRGWAKTTHGAQGIPIWRALCEHGHFSLIVGKNDPHGKEILLPVVMELEANERILQDFGEQATDVWGFENGFLLRNGRWLDCVGWEGRVRGKKKGPYRPDYIVVDDIEDRELVRSPRRVKQMIQWWLTEVMFAFGDESGVAVWLCTNIHGKSATSLLLNPEYSPFEGEEPPQFTRLKFRATNEDGQSAWPDRFSDERLAAMKARMGSRAFEQEMNGLAMADGGMFRPEWIRWVDASEVPTTEMVTVGAVDPSVKSSGKADMKAVQIWSKHLPTSRYYVRYCWLRQGTDSELVDAMYRGDAQLSPIVWWFEAQGAFELFKYPLAEGAKRFGGKRLPVRFFTQSLPKEIRIRSLEAPFEQGLVHFVRGAGDVQVLAEQFEHYPTAGVADDGPDASEMIYRYLQPLGTSHGEGNYNAVGGKRSSAGLGKLI